ncbi:hypothetical protein [Leptospira sp. 'Mane']|uniref:hypothetical protein n=1 Tax=Leptospira sp. 'Mane' TaxID=3387407 RepID=UPI00398B919E
MKKNAYLLIIFASLIVWNTLKSQEGGFGGKGGSMALNQCPQFCNDISSCVQGLGTTPNDKMIIKLSCETFCTKQFKLIEECGLIQPFSCSTSTKCFQDKLGLRF